MLGGDFGRRRFCPEEIVSVLRLEEILSSLCLEEILSGGDFVGGDFV
jgi:hypothetical protein